jgi:hypothetical protein
MPAQATEGRLAKDESEPVQSFHRQGCPKRRIERYEQPRPPRSPGQPAFISEVIRCQDCGGQSVTPTDREYDPADPKFN